MNIVHLAGAIIASSIFLGFNAFIQTVIPWKVVFMAAGIPLAGVIIYFLFENFSFGDIRGSGSGPIPGSSKSYEMNVKPMEVPDFINRQIDEMRDEGVSSPVKKLNVSYTHADNEKSRIQTKPSDRYEKYFTIVVSRPMNQDAAESIAFLVDITDKKIWDYTGNLHTAKERNRPFKGKYDYLFKKDMSGVKKGDKADSALVDIHADGKGQRNGNGGSS